MIKSKSMKRLKRLRMKENKKKSKINKRSKCQTGKTFSSNHIKKYQKALKRFNNRIFHYLKVMLCQEKLLNKNNIQLIRPALTLKNKKMFQVSIIKQNNVVQIN